MRLTTRPFVIRHTVPSPAFETQADPKPQATPYGSRPTPTGLPALPVRVSMRVSVPRAFDTTQMAPGLAARLKILGPTGTRPSVLPLFGSMRTTSPSDSPPTQIALP